MRARLVYLTLSPRTPRRIAHAAGRVLWTAYDVTTRAAAYAALVTFVLYVISGAVAQAAGR